MNCATMCRSILKDPVCGTVGGKHSISLATETMEKKTINICHHLHPASNHSWPLPAPSILTEYAWLSPALKQAKEFAQANGLTQANTEQCNGETDDVHLLPAPITVALFDTHVFLLNEYLIELNTANFKNLNTFLN